ncbi:hypothetical protein [Aureimonas sp. SK2]|uniref:hypothetical protein n=1 Tax=Aureimonas sp. SK2 TaxID=3015992 RepID=UPI00244472A5|nr:hypothetical protein [Aureimonas sp. SK2]
MQIAPAVADRLTVLNNRFPIGVDRIIELGIDLVSRTDPDTILWLTKIGIRSESERTAIIERLFSPANRKSAELGVAS